MSNSIIASPAPSRNPVEIQPAPNFNSLGFVWTSALFADGGTDHAAMLFIHDGHLVLHTVRDCYPVVACENDPSRGYVILTVRGTTFPGDSFFYPNDPEIVDIRIGISRRAWEAAHAAAFGPDRDPNPPKPPVPPCPDMRDYYPTGRLALAVVA